MIKRILILASAAALLIAATILAQGPPQQPQREAPAPNVSFDRLLKPGQEPQNWLVYGGSFISQRHSPPTQINPANAKDLELKRGFQSPSLRKHKVHPPLLKH